MPLEIERDTRNFDDAEYAMGDLFSARIATDGTTVVAYDGHDAWSAH